MKFKNPAFIVKATWSDKTIISDIYRTKESVLEEVESLLEEADEVVQISIEVVGIISE